MSSNQNGVNKFDIMQLMCSDAKDVTMKTSPSLTQQSDSKRDEKQQNGPICQTLSYFDVIYPHLQIAYARSSLNTAQASRSGANTSDDRSLSARSFELGNFCKVLFKQMNKNKRTRTSFTVDQLEGLEKYFKENQYVTSSDRKLIADRLALSETQVKIWFQNRRTKHKRDNFGGESD